MISDWKFFNMLVFSSGYTCNTHSATGSIFDRITIQNTIKEGRIVPSIVTVRLLQSAMRKSDKTKLLIDGFPRNDENRITFEDEVRLLVFTGDNNKIPNHLE
jgi:UMP-CMP kinase